MPEHTPAPTPSRSVYGFVLYLCSKTFFILYVVWTVIPESWFAAINITYLPQRYWAVVIPIFLLTVLAIFAFAIYPSLNLCLTPNINDVRTIKEYSKKRKIVTEEKRNIGNYVSTYTCCCKTKETCFADEFIKNNENAVKYSVPMVNDLCIADVSKTLYLKNNE